VKWVYLIGGTLVVLVAVMAIIGGMLPRDHRATRQARFRQTPETIYATLAGPIDWRSGIKASGALPDQNGRKMWWEQDSHGNKITYELLEDSPPSRRVTRIADEGLPYGGTWTVEIAPAGGGSTVRVTEDGQVYNVIFRFMSRFIFGHTATIEAFLRDLGRRFGESAAIEP
jgi:hypothetical protein